MAAVAGSLASAARADRASERAEREPFRCCSALSERCRPHNATLRTGYALVMLGSESLIGRDARPAAAAPLTRTARPDCAVLTLVLNKANTPSVITFAVLVVAAAALLGRVGWLVWRDRYTRLPVRHARA